MRGKIGSMSIVLLLFIGAFLGLMNFSSINVQAQTNVSGPQYDGSGGPWTLAGSPYIVVGDVTVPAGEILTIDPGVQVRFDGHFRITVNGNLSAIGTAANRINITSNSTTPAQGDWDQIRVPSGGHAEVSYTDISYADYGLFLFTSSNHNITRCNISSSQWTGVYLSQSDNNNIIGNDISMTGGSGLYSWLSDSNNITGNNFTGNLQGVELDLSMYNRVYHNSFINNVNLLGWDNGASNLWNLTYSQYPFQGGNYWSDFSPTCTDVMNGPDQDISGADGICDSNYTVGSFAVDHYPLKDAWVGAPPDTIPPDEITLSAGTITQTSIVLTWTAVADDESIPASGPASLYDIRYSTGAGCPISDIGKWGTATQATGEPMPQVVGSPESFNVTGLNPSTLYCFAARVGDEVPNWSVLSNSPELMTLTPPPDTERPEISNVGADPEMVTQGGSVNITADVTDDSGTLDHVKVHIIAPDGTTKGNFTMGKGEGDTYYYVYDIDADADPGTYKFVIWTADTSANTARSAAYTFTVPSKDIDPGQTGLTSEFWLILLINDIVLIVAVLVVVLLLLRRKREPVEAPREVPPQVEEGGEDTAL